VKTLKTRLSQTRNIRHWITRIIADESCLDVSEPWEIGYRPDLKRYDYQSLEHPYGGISDQCQIRFQLEHISQQIRRADITKQSPAKAATKRSKLIRAYQRPGPGQGSLRINTTAACRLERSSQMTKQAPAKISSANNSASQEG